MSGATKSTSKQTSKNLFGEESPEVVKKSKLIKKDYAGEKGMTAPSAVGKNFVLDTNVLVHDPSCINRFADNHVCIPADVLSELDRFKGEQSERGANARRVHRRLNELFATADSVTGGVPTPGGGTIRLVIYDFDCSGEVPAMLRTFTNIFQDRGKVDHRIMALTLVMKERNPGLPVVLVTKDINMQLKARTVGIQCEDYKNDKVDIQEVKNSGDLRKILVEPHDLQRFASTGSLKVDDATDQTLTINEYVMLAVGDKQTIPARCNDEGFFVSLNVPDVIKIPGGHFIKPLNIQQKCYLDALLNPEISLVTVYGQAGTGKTLLAMAAALNSVLGHQDYNGMTVSRPIVAMGEQLGFLPGSIDEKMRPWLQPIYDALDLLMIPPVSAQGPRRKQHKKQQADPSQQEGASKPYDYLIQQGTIDIEALCYIRGRSIPNRYFVLDEAQQLTPQEAKTVVTRMSEGSKLVFVGDPAQIDNPYVDSQSNGLVYTRNRLKGQPFVAHITLSRGERSDLAEAGATCM